VGNYTRAAWLKSPCAPSLSSSSISQHPATYPEGTDSRPPETGCPCGVLAPLTNILRQMGRQTPNFDAAKRKN